MKPDGSGAKDGIVALNQTALSGVGSSVRASPGTLTAVAAQRTPVDVFISHVPTDAHHRDALERHLAVLRRQGLIRSWHQGHVEAGEDRARQTVGRLEAAKVIVLLISVEYLAADPYWNEMEQALSRHDATKAHVIPVLVDACDWDLAPFGRLKPLPSNGRPVTSWLNQSEAWADVASGIRAAVGWPGSSARSNPRRSCQRTRTSWERSTARF